MATKKKAPKEVYADAAAKKEARRRVKTANSAQRHAVSAFALFKRAAAVETKFRRMKDRAAKKVVSEKLKLVKAEVKEAKDDLKKAELAYKLIRVDLSASVKAHTKEAAQIAKAQKTKDDAFAKTMAKSEKQADKAAGVVDKKKASYDKVLAKLPPKEA